MFSIPSLRTILYMIPGILLGLSLHEFAHGWAADLLGDHTARRAGRLTLNPVAHIDIIGLLALILTGFGWAKPVPVNFFLFRGDKRRAIILVSLAGPLANLLLAVLGALLLGAVLGVQYIQPMVVYLIQINTMLAIFNLVPIPPLDGSKILMAILPGRQEWLLRIEPYGFLILILLLYTGIFYYVISPPISLIVSGLQHLSWLVSTILR